MPRRIILITCLLFTALGVYLLWRSSFHKTDNPAKIATINSSDSSINSNDNQKKSPGTTRSQESPDHFQEYKNTNLGIAFQYPDNWKKQPGDVGAVNLKGEVTTIEINFNDSSSGINFLLIYHQAPNGMILYNHVLSQFASSEGLFKNGAGSKIQVAGKEAIEGNTVLHKDGRGKTLSVPLLLKTVYFLDEKQTGEFELQLKAPKSIDTTAVSQFRHLLSTFRFNKP